MMPTVETSSRKSIKFQEKIPKDDYKEPLSRKPTNELVEDIELMVHSR